MSLSPSSIRKAADRAIQNMVRQQGDIVPWASIAAGFHLEGETILFANRAKGIFKPAQLKDGAPLSVKSSRPSRVKRDTKYNDEIIADGLLRYCFRKDESGSSDNKMLLEAWKRQLPLIYLNGLADAVYQIFYPTHITQYDPIRREVLMSWDHDEDAGAKGFLLNDPHHLLGRRTSINQLQHARFRANVLAAYNFQCAFSRLSVGSMLRAASLVDSKEASGVPAVRNAVCMSVLYQTAFDANLIGITPEGRVEASPLLGVPQHSILRKQLGIAPDDRWNISLPKARNLRPDLDCLEARYKLFKEAQS